MVIWSRPDPSDPGSRIPGLEAPVSHDAIIEHNCFRFIEYECGFYAIWNLFLSYKYMRFKYK